jgi:hypothetical protein
MAEVGAAPHLPAGIFSPQAGRRELALMVSLVRPDIAPSLLPLWEKVAERSEVG